jgi:hypothetical protein
MATQGPIEIGYMLSSEEHSASDLATFAPTGIRPDGRSPSSQ